MTGPVPHTAERQPVWDRLKLSEPVRVRLYPLTLLIVGFLVSRGVLTSGDAYYFYGLAGIVFGGGIAATEFVRDSVVSPRTTEKTARLTAMSASDDPAIRAGAVDTALAVYGIPTP